MNETSSKNEITSGIIWKQLLLFFFPILLGSFFQQLYNTIDAVIVGRFVRENALAAVAGFLRNGHQPAGQLFLPGLTAGASVIVSQFFGSGDRKKVDDSIHTIYAFSIIGSVIMTLIGITAAPALLRLMNTPEELMSDSILYLRIYFAGIFFVFIYNTGAGLLRALGDSRRPLYCLMICCVINIVLDLAPDRRAGTRCCRCGDRHASLAGNQRRDRYRLSDAPERSLRFFLKRDPYPPETSQIRVAFRTAGRISVCHVQHFQHDYPVRAQQIRNRHGWPHGRLTENWTRSSGWSAVLSVLPSQLSSVRTTAPESMTASEKVSACVSAWTLLPPSF